MNTEEAFTPEQVTEVVGALHNATMDKWLGAGLTLVIGAVVIKNRHAGAQPAGGQTAAG